MADSKTKIVQFKDLDLSTAAGQERLMTRVNMAIKQVCASPGAITVKERMDQNRCKKVAAASAMPKAERTIAAYVESRSLASRDTQLIVGN